MVVVNGVDLNSNYAVQVRCWPGLSEKDIMLIEACKEGDLEKAKKALDEGANINASGVTKETKESLIAGNVLWGLEQVRNTPPVGLAIRYDHPELAEYLIDRGADVNFYPQHASAARRGYIPVLKKMKEQGLDLNRPETSSCSPDEFAIEEAAETGQYETFVFLIKNGVKLTEGCLWRAFWGKNPEIIREIMKARDGRLYDTGDSGKKYFIAHNIESLELLTKAGVDLKGNEKNGYPIAMTGSEEIILALLDLGASRSSLDKNPILKPEERRRIYKKWLKQCKLRNKIENIKNRKKQIHGVVVADKIAKKVIDGEEKRPITREVGKELSNEIKKKYALSKKQNA